MAWLEAVISIPLYDDRLLYPSSIALSKFRIVSSGLSSRGLVGLARSGSASVYC